MHTPGCVAPFAFTLEEEILEPFMETNMLAAALEYIANAILSVEVASDDARTAWALSIHFCMALCMIFLPLAKC